ncbi:uncharacterized protein BYT42DRAFT_522487 [Radiomyces spectabilis]|uniref:uncharacterized protein n=1 Tax=Radiomyces spectabilis TaxID=64574 RepID=UPI00221FC527|nr:uncharacterized protein BYT42DRAFT_522487 [Radiomyces spectabilis]KAI8367651.1 hypothetical protein BYT42DRAFT_522487 [Radiomyces spectabilis]
MNAEEAESYQFQLDQIEFALSKDPENEELKKLRTDLKELIALTQQFDIAQSSSKKDKKSPATPSTPTSASTSTPTTQTQSPVTSKSALASHQFAVGQEVLAKWSGDGQFYRATITAIGGADQVFSVVFRGYKESEVVKAEDVQLLEKDKKRPGIFEDVVAPPKKKKAKKDKPSGPKKVSEAEVKKNAWLNFASKSDKSKTKKKMAATPINKKSIFKTPDNPEGKVGVIGSGRGMTGFQRRGKHVYTGGENDED